MTASNEVKPFARVAGRVARDPTEHIPTDKHGRTLQEQHDPSPDWGRTSADRLATKRYTPITNRLFK